MGELTKAAVAEAAQAPVATQALVGKMLDLPQAPVSVCHLFGQDTYMREVKVPAGVLLVGRTHRNAHDCILYRGAVTIINADGTRTPLRGPLEFRAEAGRTVAIADEDAVLVTIHRTPERDLEVLEAQIFADTAPAMPFEPLPPDGDYAAMLVDIGATAAAVRQLSEYNDDVGPLPNGRYKFKVGRSRIEGKGLIATADMPMGDCIAAATWEDKRTPASRYVNHAKNPNAMFALDGDGTAWLIAVRPIAGSRRGYDGEEVTVDYRNTLHAHWAQLS